jgi:hypothetical protein
MAVLESNLRYQSPTPISKGGRPRKEIDQRTFEELCKIQCTLAEIAGVLRVSEDTVERWCEREYGEGFAEVYKKHSAGGKSSLRRQQFALAMKGNATMLIWLGKQYLGQTDRTDRTEGDVSEEELNAAIETMIERKSKSLNAVGDGRSDLFHRIQ